MSIRNQRTGRHEDDLAAEAYANGGRVSLESLLEHLDEILGDPASGYGEGVYKPVAAAVRVIKSVRGWLPDDHSVSL